MESDVNSSPISLGTRLVPSDSEDENDDNEEDSLQDGRKYRMPDVGKTRLDLRTKEPMSPTRRLAVLAVAGTLFLLFAAVSPEPFLGHFMVFMLSVVIGFYVIGNVHHALHTPLMSVTNAISGIIVVGAILLVRPTRPASADRA